MFKPRDNPALVAGQTLIARQVRAARIARGWTQKELGRQAGVSQAHINNIENDREASTKVLQAVATALGGHYEEVFTTGGEPPRRAPAIAQQLPSELDAVAARWMEILPHLPDHLTAIIVEEIDLWERKYGSDR